MDKLDKGSAITMMNELSAQSKAFVFFVDFDQQEIIISQNPVEDQVYFNFLGYKNEPISPMPSAPEHFLDHYPISYEDYKFAFDQVMMHLKTGDSYLVNLAFPTLIRTNLSMEDIFLRAEAKFKGYIPGEFVFFSPERFVDIIDGHVSTYPMKGTIDAAIPNAADRVLSDPKELAEHSTVVDLLRNDLSQVCTQVQVQQFRYIDRVISQDKELLQVSSKITGQLTASLHGHLGDVLFRMLPAGSISGAPKRKTVDIIKSVESVPRRYYTGVCGYFDSADLRTGVMIRMIQPDDYNNLYYYSGGGITAQSNPRSEYQELIDKVYVPIARDHQDCRRTDLQHSLS